MRKKIDELIWSILSFGRECSDEWWVNQKSSGRPFIDHRRKYLYSLLIEEIKKELLRDEEIIQALAYGYDWYRVSSADRQIAQAQLRKIIKKLEEK